MIPEPPRGQGPIDPRGALIPPPPPDSPPDVAGFSQQPNYNPALAMGPAAGVGQSGAAMSQMSGMNPQQLGPGAPMPQTGGPPMQGGYPPMGPGGWGAPPYQPGMRPPGYPPPKRGGIGRILFFIFVFLLLGASVLLNLVLLPNSISAGSSGGVVQTTIRSPGSSSEQIAIVPIEGMIDEACEARVERFINRAREDNVKAVVLLIDTPGGTVTASDEIYKRVKKFKSDTNVPVVVAMRGMATSGGYYAACAADYICAERTTLTGNIGVLMPRYNFNKLMDKYGIEDNTTVATGATYKDAGSPTRATNDRDNAYFQKEIDAAFDIFKKVVTDGRGPHLKKSIDEIANGMAYSGDEALQLGLVDKIDDVGYLDAAIDYATTTARLSKPQVIIYHDPPPSLLNLLSAKYVGGQAGASGVTINVDATVLDQMASPRIMYLYRGAVAH